MKKAIDFFTSKPARVFLLVALLCMCILHFVNSKLEIQWKDIFVEANGMVFDLLVFGALLYAYEAFREKRDRIERLHEEIDDYRGWDEKEATYRIAGAIKRLNKLGESKINLKNCFLKDANLKDVNLQFADLKSLNLEQANLEGANLEGANLDHANLQYAKLQYANLKKSQFFEANLTGASLQHANLEDANLMFANLQYVDLENANLQKALLYDTVLEGAILIDTDLKDAFVAEDWFVKIHIWDVLGKEEIKMKYNILNKRIIEINKPSNMSTPTTE